jgi:ABC-type oligopeptide transport system ATPase subunit
LTLARTILGLHTPTEGEIRYRGDKVTALSSAERKQLRQDIQFIF